VVLRPALPSPKIVNVKESSPLKPGFDRYVAPADPADADPFFGGDMTLTEFAPVRSILAVQDVPLAVAMVPLVI
jgi:hypothetical protein